MLPFGVTIPATAPQGSEIPEGNMNNPVYIRVYIAFPKKDYLLVNYYCLLRIGKGDGLL
jgi:hypothetical protein